MRIVVDKVTLLAFAICLLLVIGPVSAAAVTWLLVSLTVSAGWGASSNGPALVPAAALGAFTLALLALPASSPLAPTTALIAASILPAHDLAHWVGGAEGKAWTIALASAPVVAALARREDMTSIVVGAGGIALAVILGVRTREAHDATERLDRMRDDLEVKVRALEDANGRLADALDHESRAAVLAERTRIARDIHDNVGHLLTRSLFQVNALQAIHAKDHGVTEGLGALSQSLDEAMTSMRVSVHALADEAEEMETALNIFAARSSIPRTDVECRIDVAPPPEVSRAIVALAREALTNAERHGRATSARIRVTEYPAFWQVTIDNDGAVPTWRGEAGLVRAEEAGLGLRSMRTRVEALGGRLRITTHPRFTVFATIPRQAPKEAR